MGSATPLITVNDRFNVWGIYVELQSKVYLKIRCSVTWNLHSFAKPQNVKLCLFGYSSEPSVITVEETKTMFLV